MSARLIQPCAMVLVYVAATIGMLWPYPAHLRTMVVDPIDTVWAIWANRWVQHQLVTDPLHLYDSNTFYPLDNTLGYSDAMIANALLSAPVWWATGDAVLTHGLLVLATFPFAATGMYLFIHRLTGNGSAAFLAGLAYAFLPFRFAHLAHPHLLGHGWTPWVMLSLWALVMRPTWWRAVAFGVVLTTQALTSVYLAFQIALVVGVTLVVLFVARSDARTRRVFILVGAALTLSVVVTIVASVPYLAVRDQQGLERTGYEAEFWKALPVSYLKTADSRVWSWVGIEGWAQEASHGGLAAYPTNEDAVFPGGLALLGATLGLVGWRRRSAATVAMVLVGMVAFILSLGPSLGPRIIDPADQASNRLPYAWLFEHVMVFRALRVAARFGVVVDFAVIVLAGLGAAWAWERSRSRLGTRVAPSQRRLIGMGGTVLLSFAIIGESSVRAIPLTPFDRSAVTTAPYDWLASQSDPGPVIEFPADNTLTGEPLGLILRREAQAMYWSTLGWWPLVNGYSGFFPPPYLAFRDTFTGEVALPDGTVVHRVSYLGAETVGVLQDLDVRYVVVHRDRYDPNVWPVVADHLALARGTLKQVAAFGPALIYEVGAGDPLSPPLQVTIRAPAMATPGGQWRSEMTIHNARPRPALLYLRQAITLAMTWRTEEGEVRYRGRQRLAYLPVTINPGTLTCQITESVCTPSPLPATPGVPTPVLSQLGNVPNETGRYTVDLVITGAVTETNRVDVRCQMQVTVGRSQGSTIPDTETLCS